MCDKIKIYSNIVTGSSEIRTIHSIYHLKWSSASKIVTFFHFFRYDDPSSLQFQHRPQSGRGSVLRSCSDLRGHSPPERKHGHVYSKSKSLSASSMKSIQHFAIFTEASFNIPHSKATLTHSLQQLCYRCFKIEIMDVVHSVVVYVGISDLWKSWWNGDRKPRPSRAEEEKRLLDCVRVQTISYCWDQTGDAGVCVCLCVYFICVAAITAFQCFTWFYFHLKIHKTSLSLDLRCQIYPVSWGRCGSTGPSCLWHFAARWRQEEPIRIIAGTASPKPGKEGSHSAYWRITSLVQ